MNPTCDTLHALIVDHLDGWTPPLPDPVEEAEAVADLTGCLGHGLDDPEDHISIETLREWRSYYAPADDVEARDWLASSIALSIMRELERAAPGNWRHWKATSQAFAWAYRVGIIDGYTSSGRAGLKGPGWRPGRRPYLLGLSQLARHCLRMQVRFARYGHQPPGGWHKPGTADVHGICGRCEPWSCCGSTTVDHTAGCPEDV